MEGEKGGRTRGGINESIDLSIQHSSAVLSLSSLIYSDHQHGMDFLRVASLHLSVIGMNGGITEVEKRRGKSLTSPTEEVQTCATVWITLLERASSVQLKSYDYISAHTAGHSKKLAPFALKRGQIYECVPYFMRGYLQSCIFLSFLREIISLVENLICIHSAICS